MRAILPAVCVAWGLTFAGLASAADVSPGSAGAAHPGPGATRSGAVAPASVTAPPRLAWRDYRSVEGNFYIKLPGEPKTVIRNNPGFTEYRYVVDLGGEGYLVGYNEYTVPMSNENPAVLLDRLQASWLKSMNGQLRKSRSKTVAGYPGREIVFDTPDRNAGKVRLFIVGNHLYQIAFIGPVGVETRPAVRVYLDSFGLIKDEGSHAAPPIATPTGSDWVSFHSAEGRFTVLLPGDPEIAAGRERGYIEHRFVVDHGDTAYIVSYADFPPSTNLDGKDPRIVLNAMQDSILTGMQGTLREHRAITVGGFPGRELVFNTPASETGLVRLYLVKNRVYQILFMGPNGEEAKPEIERYLDSFQVANTEPE